MLCAETLRVQAYFDGELDALSAADIERHNEACAECLSLLKGLDHERIALRQDRRYVTASPALRARILRKLDDEAALKGTRLIGPRRAKWRPNSFWSGA